eukprot:6117888-Ditylum_brightwellii.AAC.1
MVDIERMTVFVENIIDPDFETFRQLLENYLLEIDCKERTLNQKGFTDIVESQQQGLNQLTVTDMEAKSRRIPNALFSLFTSEQKKAFLRWKNCTANSESVSSEGIQKILKQTNSDQQGSSGCQKKKQKRKTRAT